MLLTFDTCRCSFFFFDFLDVEGTLVSNFCEVKTLSCPAEKALHAKILGIAGDVN